MKSASLTPAGSLRQYRGEYDAHAHDFAQVLVGLEGCLELELEGRAAFVDGRCGLIVPAGVAHRFMAETSVRVLVIDAPDRAGLDRTRRFAVPARGWLAELDVVAAHGLPGRVQAHGLPDRAPAALPLPAFDAVAALDRIAGAPRVLARRAVDPARLERLVGRELHADWPTSRMAGLFHLSAQRFHARMVELTGRTPQAWLRELRLDEAVRRIRAGSTLEATAGCVGYRSASALAYALRRERSVGARGVRRSAPR